MYQNKIIIFLFLIGLISAQSLLNTYGLGQLNSSYGTAALGNGSSYLTPSFSEGVSLSNPATWRNLNFTYIHTGYDERRITFDNGEVSQTSGLNRAQFIVPFKAKYAFGLSLNPYTYRQSELTTAVDDFENLITYKTEGGLNTLTPSIGVKVSESESIGFSYSFLFGSSRLLKSMVLNSVTYAQASRLDHSGSTMDFYIQSERFGGEKKVLSLYGHVGITIKPIDVTQYKYYLYQDNDGSGHHNNSNIAAYADFPYLGNVPPPDTVRMNNTYKPFSFNVGFNYASTRQWNLIGEIGFVNNNYSLAYKNYSPLQDAISNQMHIQFGINRFSRQVVRKWTDRFSFRSGLFSNRYRLNNSENSIIENGIAIGFGFIFGITKNQIDLSYQIGYRSGLPEIDNETFSKFSIGLSLGDIWFVKRREL